MKSLSSLLVFAFALVFFGKIQAQTTMLNNKYGTMFLDDSYYGIDTLGNMEFRAVYELYY
ncbi:MAG: hypothetical protein PHD11_08645 [Bacteroidales bacterium]|jgi:hypothetical protein|nr:hypothetical protein [Bacteroidales bacterium]MDD4671245.1 hypothetical protein [Bacteroidales bacterium]